MTRTCKLICKKLEDTRPSPSRVIGDLPRCGLCGFAFMEDWGQVRCPCCKTNLRRRRK